MFGRLLPRETSFFDFFERHAALTVEGTKEFLSMVSTGANVEGKAKRIKEIEHETDVITHHCVEALHKTFITPIERDDIHRLITKMDDVMDFVEAAAERISLYEISQMTQEVKDLADVLVRAAEEVFGLENDADAILRKAVARLFKEERDPITIIKWKEIYEFLEVATDRCEDVANIIEGVVLEHA
jgi:uncharacterized protein Yka (UPF0111/DUF47 family)